ncbi:MAG: hypothetical protein ISR95_05465 [Candidatus Marinimicrobia bacterium]|nr:hypothetical protein [Candidatus Neomarinimicrobiota bacterium]
MEATVGVRELYVWFIYLEIVSTMSPNPNLFGNPQLPIPENVQSILIRLRYDYGGREVKVAFYAAYD